MVQHDKVPSKENVMQYHIGMLENFLCVGAPLHALPLRQPESTTGTDTTVVKFFHNVLVWKVIIRQLGADTLTPKKVNTTKS